VLAALPKQSNCSSHEPLCTKALAEDARGKLLVEVQLQVVASEEPQHINLDCPNKKCLKTFVERQQGYLCDKLLKKPPVVVL
jgi:hypothetical protein